MAARRSLVEGVNPPPPPVDPALEHEFVFGRKNAAKITHQPKPPKSATTVARTPISSKIRTDFAEALKRASLQRQLDKVQPNTLQDILEEAVEPWLRSNGYLT